VPRSFYLTSLPCDKLVLCHLLYICLSLIYLHLVPHPLHLYTKALQMIPTKWYSGDTNHVFHVTLTSRVSVFHLVSSYIYSNTFFIHCYLVPHPVAVSGLPGSSWCRRVYVVLDWLRQLRPQSCHLRLVQPRLPRRVSSYSVPQSPCSINCRTASSTTRSSAVAERPARRSVSVEMFGNGYSIVSYR